MSRRLFKHLLWVVAFTLSALAAAIVWRLV